jgi:hypothetical protein
MIQAILRFLAVLGALLLAGCAANQMPGFQNTYYSYNVPESLLEKIRIDFRYNGLLNARIARDNVGRVQLKGSYKNEDEVDRAFIIVQTIVGIKSTSPFYPEDIKDKRWGTAAGKALAEDAKANRVALGRPQKRALVIGINTFQDSVNIPPIQGEDDAALVKNRAEAAGYKVTALLGKDATKSNIEAALKKMKTEVGPDDSLFIYISSHGTQPVPSRAGQYDRKMSIVAWDSSPYKNNKKIEKKTTLNLNMQEASVSDVGVQELGNMPTRNTRILIDTCYSGEMLKGIVDDESNRYKLSANDGQPEQASITPSAWIPAYASKGIHLNDESAPSSFKTSTKNSQKNEIYNYSGRFTLITATSDGQKSWGPPPDVGTFESPLSPYKMLKGSIFTQVFFEYLDHYKGHIEPAFEKARKFTEKKVLTIHPPADWKGPVPIKQVPRLEPSLPPADQNNLYQ